MLRLLRLVSLRHMRLSPLRTLLTVLGVAVGVAVTVAIAAVNRSVLESFRSMVDTVSGKADLTIAQSKSRFDDALLDTVSAVPGVAHAAGSLSLVLPVQGMPGESLYLLCTNFTDDGYFRSLKTSAGQPKLHDVLGFLNSTDELLLSEKFARAHGLKTGDTLTLITPKGAQKFHIRSLLANSGPATAFGGSFAVMDLYSAEAAFDMDHQIDRIDVAVKPGEQVDAVKARLQKAAGPAFSVERPSRRGASVQKMLLSFQVGLNMGSALALLVGIFLVYNTISIGVVQRRREIGTLRALGASGGLMRALFTLEAAILGGLGAAVGIPLGWLIARRAIAGVADAISSIYVHVHATAVTLHAPEVAAGFALGILGSCFAAFRPASAASRVPPVEALRKSVSAPASPSQVRVQVAVGLGMLALAAGLLQLPPPTENFPLGGYLAIFAVLMGATALTPPLIRWARPLLVVPAELLAGVPGRLAADNFSRAPGRSAMPVAALSIGIAMSIALGGFIGSFKAATQRWLRANVPSDLFVTSSYKLGGVRNVPMPQGLADQMARIPGVAAVDKVRLLQHDFMGLRIFVLSLDPRVYWKRAHPLFLEGDEDQAVATALDGKSVILSENLARRRHLHKGDTIQMKTPTGVHAYVVRGVIYDYTSDQGLVAMSRDMYVRDFGDTQVDTFEIYLKKPSDRDAVREAITARWGQKYDLYVLTNDELRAESTSIIDQTFQVTYAMEIVAVLLALLGVVNTLLAAVIDRTREIGLLRAVGATRAQVVKTVAVEAGCMGLLGAVVGTASGTVLAKILLVAVGLQGTGWAIPLQFPWSTAVQMALAAIACAVGAGLYPARRAASLDVVDALSYE